MTCVTMANITGDWTVSDPTYEQLVAAYKKLHRVALNINDNLRREVDHAVFIGTSENVDELSEAVNEHFSEWNDFLYSDLPRSDEEQFNFVEGESVMVEINDKWLCGTVERLMRNGLIKVSTCDKVDNYPPNKVKAADDDQDEGVINETR